MNKSLGTRARVALASLGALGLAAGAAGPASAAAAATTPTQLFNDYQYCSTDPNAPSYQNSLGGMEIEGLSQDTVDYPWFSMQYQVWPVGAPTQITTLSDTYANSGYESGVSVPQADLVDGQEYAWQAQAVGSGGASAWSATCYVAIDNTRPDAVPAVTSANYPAWRQDPAGTPIQITLGANAVGDVAGYAFSWNGDPGIPMWSNIGAYGIPQPANPWNVQPGTVFKGYSGEVRNSGLGGSVTVDLIPPQDSGLAILTVESLDRAFNASATTQYWIFFKPDAPTITLQGDKPKFGVQTPFLLTPDPGIEAASPVTSYDVVESGGSGQQNLTIPADANGDATLHVTDDSEWGMGFTVQSVSADGWVSQGQWYSIDSFPGISSDVYPIYGYGGGAGVSGTFTFSSPVKNIASFSYTVNGGPATAVHAANGQAQITFTPPASGWYDIEVTPIAKDGTTLFPNDYYFGVN